ncbi:transcription termination/antitermination NusG family protein [Blautia sp. HCP3S3_G3]|uniref:transcription termination/antitermination NusG family protein n=1 Tax=Blautia sp. HCP3S3_G3 TaxID=3438913 RepID=UPI003F8B3133
MKNWYILFVQTEKQSQLCFLLEQEGVHAFLPMMEYYRRDRRGLAEKPMFPGYIFVQSELTQKEFDDLLDSMKERRWGFIRQLKEEGGSALTEEEKAFFQWLLDDGGTARMSYGYLNPAGTAVITYGPLIGCERHIRKTDRHNRLVLMDFAFREEPVKLGLTILTMKELKEQELYTEETESKILRNKEKGADKTTEEERVIKVFDEELQEEVEIDIEALIGKMTQL